MVTVLARLLYDLLRSRMISTGTQLISDRKSVLAVVAPDDPDGPFLYYVLSGWLKHSKDAVGLIGGLHSAYTTRCWPSLSIRAWSWIEGGKALVGLHEHRAGEAEEACRWIQTNRPRFDEDTDLMATTDFVIARLMRRQANYTLALQHGRAACAGYSELNLPRMAGLADITVAWALGQLGRRREAHKLLQHAYDALSATEDKESLGAIHHALAREFNRRGLDEEALQEFDKADAFLINSPHSRRRVLMDAANVLLRKAKMARDNCPAAAQSLSSIASKKLDLVGTLLDPNKSADKRDQIRLSLAHSNEAFRGITPRLSKARAVSKTAYELAAALDDKLMMARAAYKQAEVEQFAIGRADNPWIEWRRALGYAICALNFTRELQNVRLKARVHTLLGKLYLVPPFQHLAAAAEHWEAAVECMAQRDDLDYLSTSIAELQTLIEVERREHTAAAAPLSIIVTDEKAFTQPLETTLQEVEREIIYMLQEILGNVPVQIANILQVGHERVDKHLRLLGEQRPASKPLHEHHAAVIFRLNPRRIFTQPLETTLQEVERAIVRAAWIKFRERTRSVLRMGNTRFQLHRSRIESEIGKSLESSFRT